MRKTPDAADASTNSWTYSVQKVEDEQRWQFRSQDEDLAGRIYNFKFQQALAYLRPDHDEDLREVVEALADVFGNTGFMPRAKLEPVVQAATWWIFGELDQACRDERAGQDEQDAQVLADIERLRASNAQLRAEIAQLRASPRLIRRPPFGDEG